MKMVEELQRSYCDVIVGKKDHGANRILLTEAHASTKV
jgi:hypothetical protein